VEVSTHARPNDEFGYNGPLGPAAADGARYAWAQTKTEVHIRIPLGNAVRGKDISFRCTGARIEVRLAPEGSPGGDDRPAALLEGSLSCKVKADEAFWTIEEQSPRCGRHLSVQMVKAEPLQKWCCLVDAPGHPRIDTRLVRFYTGEAGDMAGFAELAGLR